MTSPTLALTEQLISLSSVTPQDGGCQDLIQARLKPWGFECHTIASGPDDFRVTNLWAIRPGSLGPEAQTLVFAGHTDVVPTGPLDKWTSPPFTPTQRDGRLYGRGASDMKTSIAAFIVAVENFLQTQPDPQHNIALLLTSDEEGPARDGTVKVCEWLQERGQRLDYCIVGEPTCVDKTGDTIKNGRRGSLSCRLTVHGVQGHIAYPHLADNPILRFAPALTELAQTHWDDGNSHFPATTWQVSNIHSGTGATNVIPGEVVVDFNFRFSTESTAEQLQERVEAILKKHQLKYTCAWTLGAKPFLTAEGELTNAMREAIKQATGITTELSTTGGTSDGRFIAPICPQVVEFGPPNASIHQIDENIKLSDIEPVMQVYLGVLQRLVK